ncbi:MAG: thioredoxin [Thermodesulfobacteriota bacterium]|nr:thioredoxin [Thermodesulfobacteriota bacterium]
MAGKNIIEINDSSFEQEVLQSDIPVLVDFWAPWCGPCRAIAPVIDDLSTEYSGKLKVAKCNVDDNPKIPARYGIRAIPTLIIFKGGNVTEQITGAVAKSQIAAAVDKAIA